MGKHQLRLLKYALRYPHSWHPYGTDKPTVQTIRSLVAMDLFRVNDQRQFRINLELASQRATA